MRIPAVIVSLVVPATPVNSAAPATGRAVTLPAVVVSSGDFAEMRAL